MCRERLQAAEDVEARMREFQKALDRYLAVCRDMEAMGYDSDVISADLCAPRDVTWSGDEFLEAERQRIEELRTVLHEMSRNRRRRRRRTPRARAVVW
jgi:glutamyl-tRNA reductase